MDQVLSSNPQIDFTSLLMATTDQNLVAEAEEKIRQYEGDNIYLFLKGLANEIQDEQKPPTSRQVAGLLLYRSLTSTDSVQKARKIERWLSFPEEFRLQIKNMSLKGLASKVREICSSSAQVVSAIAVIEIPRGQWTELINKLLGQIQDQTSEVKESILRCLGFICQDIPDIKCIQDYSDAILTAVVSGMNQNQGEAVMLAATNALNNSLFFAQKNFEKENERNYIMEVVCQMISVGNHEIRLKALECIINISEYYYKYLQPYMERIFGLTIRLMADSIDEEEVKMAIEFWATICDIEISFRYNKFQPDKINLQLTRQASHHIVPVIIRILEQKDEEFQQEDFSRILAAADLLSKITQEVDKQIIDDIIKYMNENISSQDWHKRDAAIHSFGLILNEQSINKTQTQTLQLLPVIMKMLLSDQSEIVKNTASWTICQITKFHKVIVIQNVENVVNNLLQAFQSPKIALAVGEMFQPYLVETMNLSVLAAQQKSNQDGLQIKDPEDFIQNLQEAILMLWTYIIQGLINDNKIQLFQQYVEFVMSFVTLSVGNATSDLQLSSQYNPHQNTQFIFGVNVPI
ncbi:MAG: putative Importin subunit beta, partial [Streblomastix strix]